MTFNVKEYAKKILKSKNQREKSKLDVHDIHDILVNAMMDGVIDSIEKQDLKDIGRYKYANMTEKAANTYETFMKGLLGEEPSKGVLIDDFRKMVDVIIQHNREKGLQPVIYPRQMTYLLYELIHDGYVSQSRVKHLEELAQVKDKFNSESFEIFKRFSVAYVNRVGTKPQAVPSKSSTIPKVHDMNPNEYRQCGSCAGSGNVVCMSCNGMGGHNQTSVDYDWDGTPLYRNEFIPCGCNGGYTICGSCCGSGSVRR